jgi:hypothetical protein
MNYNLDNLLDEVIKEYGANKGYIKPRIRWSNFNRIYSFGVVCKNKIETNILPFYK